METKTAKQFLIDRGIINPDCNDLTISFEDGRTIFLTNLLKEYSDHITTSQKQTIERLREFVDGRIRQLESQQGNPEILDQKKIDCKLECYEEVKIQLKQLLNTTEPTNK